MNRMILCVLFAALSGQALANETELELTSSEASELHATKPYFNRSLGRVTVEGESEYSFFTSYRNLLKTQLFDSNAFDSDADNKLRVRATLLKWEFDGPDASVPQSQKLGVPYRYDCVFRYDLMDGEQSVATWTITTHGISNSINHNVRITEATEIALKRNVRSFILSLKAKFDQEESKSATQSLAKLGSETDNTRGLGSYLLLGAFKTGQAVGSAGSAVLSAGGSALKGVAESCRSDPSCANQKPGDSLASLETQMANDQRYYGNQANEAYQKQNERTLRANQEALDKSERDFALQQQARQEAKQQEQERQEQVRQHNQDVAQQEQQRNQQQELARQQQIRQQEIDKQEQAKNQALAREQAQAKQQTLAREQEQARQQEERKKEIARQNAAPKSQRVTAEGDSELCFGRAVSESQAKVVTEIDANHECEALGSGWLVNYKPIFPGYSQCTPCTGGERGNFRCKITQATYECNHR